MAQEITKLSTKANLTKLQVKLATSIIVIFDTGYLKETNMSPIFEVLLAREVAYLSNFGARLTQGYQNLCPRVVWLINKNNVMLLAILVVILLMLYFHMS